MTMDNKFFNLSAANKLSLLLITLFSISCLRLCAESVIMTPTAAKEAREKFVNKANELIGCPYVYGAVGPDKFDCSGFVYYAAREALKIQLPRTSRSIYNYTTPVKDTDREPGDLVFFKTTSSGNISHVGIYIGDNKFISALSDGPSRGVVVSSLSSSYWKPRYYGAGQIVSSGKMKEQLEKFEDSEEYDVDGLLDTISRIEQESKKARESSAETEQIKTPNEAVPLDPSTPVSSEIIKDEDKLVIEKEISPGIKIRIPLEEMVLHSYDEVVSRIGNIIKRKNFSKK